MVVSALLSFWKDCGTFAFEIRQSTEEMKCSARQKEKNLELEEFWDVG